jgi:transposase
MLIVGVDYHLSFQQIAFFDQETGECGERRLNHSDGETERFYRELQQRGVSVRVRMEATSYSRWFERLLAGLGIEVWMGDAAKIKSKRVRKQKTDRQDVQLLLKLLLENNFPRVWVPSPENRDVWQLLWHRHRLVQMRTRIMNQLQALAMNEGTRWKKKLWSEEGRSQLEKRIGATGERRRESSLLLTVEEVACLLHVPVSWVYERSRRRGPEQLPHFKIGKYLRFEVRALKDFIQRQRRA